MQQRPEFGYQPEKLDRELCPYYIKASETDIAEMLKVTGLPSLSSVYQHITKAKPVAGKFIERLEYHDLADHVFNLSAKNKKVTSFIGDGLTHYAPSPIVGDICGIRGLTTAYTPYQPERSQGTLQTLWIYQNILAELTGFEGINASLYERSTAIFEAINCARRLNPKKQKVLVIDSLYRGDKEVLATMIADTDIEIEYLSLDKKGISTEASLAKVNAQDFGAVVFTQVTNLGTLEDVNLLADFATENNLISVAVIDPMLLTNEGLKSPARYGSKHQGVTIIVGDAQSFALDKNFGGPGLGLFGIRYNEANKIQIRQTPGRFIGKGKDIKGRECKTMVLSTREQHIRREKATSNICSNQSFVASLAGANLMYWGDKGLTEKIKTARERTLSFLNKVLPLEGVELAYPEAYFFNEVSLKLSKSLKDLKVKALALGLELGVEVKGNLKFFFSDSHSTEDVNKLVEFFKTEFKSTNTNANFQEIAPEYLRDTPVSFANHNAQEVVSYYQKLGSQNISPDTGVYPLGSCTMKYNPYINDYCASFAGFTNSHPQSDISLVQGNLELLFEIQEFFKKVTGLPGVTTQPVAGAQGELVGLKMFQAYHRAQGQSRKKMIIPRSAHGTNPATAAVAGYEIVSLNSNEKGQIDMDHLRSLISTHGKDIAGVMVTNPNTAGIFEENFREMSELIHQVDGLVYMDGANMNAIAGHIDLGDLGVDAVHNNLHKTWTIPHGGGGPGDAIVAVSEKLVDFLPGKQVIKNGTYFEIVTPKKTIGSFHRHWGNFAHKVRAYTYIKALGTEGVKKMAAFSVVSARYLLKKLENEFPILPFKTIDVPRMHEFIITLTDETFKRIEAAGIPKAQIIARIGKLFLDFGFHAPTVAFPEVYGLMIEPTESFSKAELDQFAAAVLNISKIINESPQVLLTVPHFTPIARVDEVSANRDLTLVETKENGVLFKTLPQVLEDKVRPKQLKDMSYEELSPKILDEHRSLS